MVYCENCFKEDLTDWIELSDGTIVCSEKCKSEWEQLCRENRGEVPTEESENSPIFNKEV